MNEGSIDSPILQSVEDVFSECLPRIGSLLRCSGENHHVPNKPQLLQEVVLAWTPCPSSLPKELLPGASDIGDSMTPA